MDWNAVAAVAELVAAFGVIVSLLYLASQVRQSTRVDRIRAEEAALTAIRDVIKEQLEDAELWRVFRTGLEDWESLTPEDQARFMGLAFQNLKGFETIHSSYVHGVMDEETWVGWQSLIAHYVDSPGFKRYLSLRRNAFSQRFLDMLDALPAPKERVTLGKVPGTEVGRSES